MLCSVFIGLVEELAITVSVKGMGKFVDIEAAGSVTFIFRSPSGALRNLLVYNSMRHDSDYKVERPDDKVYAPAPQYCYLKLYDFDEETNQLFVIDPMPQSFKWTVKDIAVSNAVFLVG